MKITLQASFFLIQIKSYVHLQAKDAFRVEGVHRQVKRLTNEFRQLQL